jgi:hypothetical protein
VVFELIEHGSVIQSLAPEMTFDEESLGDWRMQLLVAELQRGYAESKRKSDLAKSVWSDKRKQARPGQAMTGKVPAWLRREPGTGEGGKPQKGEPVKLRIIEERAEVVRRIFRLYLEGEGCVRIAGILDREKAPTLGRSGRWSHFYVNLILHNRAVVGEGRRAAQGARYG